MNSPIVSIIIPVYNAARYLEQCIRSVLSQTYDKWELLLVDDGSEDDSCQICHYFSEMDDRVKYFQKNNTGVSDTRNLGLDMSKGKYVMFLDADDYWRNEQILEKLLSYALRFDITILKGQYVEFSDDCQIQNVENKNENVVVNLFNDSNSNFIRQYLKGNYFVWTCLFKRDFIGKCRFNTERVFLEDAQFLLSLLSKPVAQLAVTECQFYAYRKHPNAVSVKHVPQKMRDAFDFTRFCFQLSDIAKDKEYSKCCVEEGIRNYLFDISVISDSISRDNNLYDWTSKYHLYELRDSVVNRIVQHQLYRYCIALLSIPLLVKYFSLRHKIRILIKGH